MRVMIDGVVYVPKQDVPVGRWPRCSASADSGSANHSTVCRRRSGSAKPTYREIESGKAADPSFAIVSRLARYYGVSLDSLPG